MGMIFNEKIKVIMTFIIIFSSNYLFPQDVNCPMTVNYEGKSYNTVQIGSQCWLKENLDIGTRIDGSLNQTNDSTIEKYCYNDSVINCTTYGGLYQWDESMQYVTTPGAQGICPEGWHIPTLAEFETLKNSTVVNSNSNTLKEIGQETGTNTSGFSALLAGGRSSDGSFFGLGYDFSYFWSSTEVSTNFAYSLNLYFSDSNCGLGYDYQEYGFSVRCVKD